MQKLQLKLITAVATGALLLGTVVQHQPQTLAASATSAAPDAADKKAAERVEKIIRENITSPNNDLKIVVTPTSRSKQGYFSEISIDGKPSQIKKLRLAEFVLHSRNVRLSMSGLAEGKLHTLQAQTTLRAVVTEEDLTARLAKGKHSAQMGLVAKYAKDPQNGDVLRITGNWSWSWFSGPVVGISKLRLADNKVYADIISLKLNGREVPAFVKSKFGEKLNPVLDYNDVPFQPRFRGVKVEGNRAIVFA